eukprot:s6228_g3.t1
MLDRQTDSWTGEPQSENAAMPDERGLMPWQNAALPSYRTGLDIPGRTAEARLHLDFGRDRWLYFKLHQSLVPCLLQFGLLQANHCGVRIDCLDRQGPKKSLSREMASEHAL